MLAEIQKHIHTLSANADPNARRQAAEDLATNATSDVVNALAVALKDENKCVRDASSRSLVTIGGKNVAGAIAPFLKDTNMVIRNLAAELLYRLGADSILALERLLHDGDHDVRKMAVEILGLLKHRDAATALIPLLHDNDANVIVAAVEGLGNLGNAIAVPHLITVFEKERYTRPVVAEALGKIKGDEATDFLAKSFSTAIENHNDDPLTLFGIIEALGTIGDEKAFALLGSHLPNVKGKLRRMMLAALVWIADKSGLPLDIPGASTSDLIELLDDSDLRVRLNAVRALANSPESEVTRAFVNAFGSSEYFDVVLLGMLESRDETIGFVLDGLESPSKKAKQLILLLRSIVKRLSENTELPGTAPIESDKADRAFNVVENRWQSADEEMRQAIVEILFMLNGNKALVMLDTLMNAPDPWLRMRVIELLATLDDPRLPDFVARYITDEDEMVRSTVAWVLENKGCSFDSSQHV